MIEKAIVIGKVRWPIQSYELAIGIATGDGKPATLRVVMTPDEWAVISEVLRRARTEQNSNGQ